MMPDTMHRDDHVSRALEVSVNVGLFILLAAACFLVLRPFLPLVAWGIIIAIAVYPGYRRIQSLMGGRKTLAAVVCTILLFALLILPVIFLTGSLVEGFQSLARHLKDGMPTIPPPPPRVATWPIVGARLNEVWELASKNLSAVLQQFAPQIRAVVPQILSASAGIGVAVLQCILSIIISGVLLANATSGEKVAHSLAGRFFGDKGPEFVALAGATIRSVTTGIIGVAFIQSIFAVLGFLVVGLPGAGLWGAIFLIAAVLQLGVVVLLPALIYVFRSCHHHQGCDLSDLVSHRGSDGQCAEAVTAGAWGSRSNGGRIPGCGWWFRGNGRHRSLSRRNYFVHRVQVVSCLGGRYRPRPKSDVGAECLLWKWNLSFAGRARGPNVFHFPYFDTVRGGDRNIIGCLAWRHTEN